MQKAIKSLLKFSTLLITVNILIIIFLLRLPLTEIIGFEFSSSTAILLFLSSGTLIIYFLRKFKSFNLFLYILRIKYKEFLTILFAPLVLATISNLLFHNCPICDGILFYLIITIPSFYIGLVLGAFAFWLNPRFSFLIFLLFFVGSLFGILVEFYINPQIYFYNSIIGYYPGTIYDEDISLDGKLIFYRLINIIIVSILLYFMKKFGSSNKKRKILALSVICLILAGMFSLKPSLGFSSTLDSIKNELKGKVITGDFEIIYPVDLKKETLQNIILHHEYYYNEVSRKTGIKLNKRITSIVFKDGAQKRKLFGSKNANVAKPWMNQMFLDESSYLSTLEHELTHLFAAEIGVTPFKVAANLNPAMIEGYAMAIENNYDDYEVHFMAALAKETGFNFPIKELYSGFDFFGRTSSFSYIFAGSFIKYLLEKYGIESVNKIYGDLNFEKHIGLNLDSLSNNYYQFLDSLNYDYNENQAALYFGRSPIFKKICMRAAANDLKKAWHNYSIGNYYSAKSIFQEIYLYSESYSSLIGIINCNSKQEKYSESVKLMNDKISSFNGISYYYNALLVYGDQLILNKQFIDADSVFTKLIELNPSTYYSNLSTMRILLLQKDSVMALNYLRGGSFDRYNILSKINNEGYNDNSLVAMVKLSEALNQNVDLLMNVLNKFPNFKDSISSNSAFELSKYLLKHFRLNEALEFSTLAIERCNRNNKINILESHKNKIEWFIKFQDKILANVDQ